MLTMSNTTSVILMIILMELLSWAFSLMISKEVLVKYLVLQGYFTILMVSMVLIQVKLAFLMLLFKMGIPPFHLWVVAIMLKLKKKEFVFFSTLHKFIPLLALAKFSSNYSLISLAVVTMVISSILIFMLVHISLVMLFSSFIHTGWMVMSSSLNLELMLTYWLGYTYVLVTLFLLLLGSNLKSLGMSQTSASALTLLVLSGLPPFIMFWLKVNVLYGILFFSPTMVWMLLFTTVLAISAYYYTFHSSCYPSLLVSSGGMITSLVPASVFLLLY
uniref:NADH dehydrogenase subunit 2 n=1 Tax=Longidorus vineacola TaxID=241698 RepID=A0A1P8C759_9BILA|nr:NADH dehydrogenase subunit 2 [Longidorus vineacola]AOT84234.1 NADH dehydrogenase subunit 2 [Longidorus vineacola]